MQREKKCRLHIRQICHTVESSLRGSETLNQACVMFTPSADSVLERFHVRHKSRRKPHLRKLLSARCRIDISMEIKHREESDESKPHVCVRKVSAGANSAGKVITIDSARIEKIHLLPKPNTTALGSSFASSFSASVGSLHPITRLRNLSGRNELLSWKYFSSCIICL